MLVYIYITHVFQRTWKTSIASHVPIVSWILRLKRVKAWTWARHVFPGWTLGKPGTWREMREGRALKGWEFLVRTIHVSEWISTKKNGGLLNRITYVFLLEVSYGLSGFLGHRWSHKPQQPYVYWDIEQGCAIQEPLQPIILLMVQKSHSQPPGMYKTM